MSTRLILTALCTVCLAARSWAQAETPPTPAAETTATIEGAAPVASTVSRDKDTLSVDFPDEDIKTILRNVADLFELNLVVPDTLTGKTSIKLRDVTWRQIFTVVLSPVGYSYIEEGNIIKVVSNESLLQEPTTTDVIIVNNAKAADLVPTVTVLVDAAAGGKIVVDARSNALVITERPSRMGRIRQTIEALDKATEQVMIETKFVEVTDRDIRNIGVNWASLQGMQLGVRGINQTWNRSRGQSFTDGNNTQGNVSTTNSSNTATNSGNSVTYGTSPTNIDPDTGAFSTSTINPVTGQVGGLPATIPSVTGVSNFVPAVPGTPAVFDVNGNVISAATPDTPASFTQMNTFNGGNTATTTAGTNATTTITDLLGLTNTGATNRVASAVFSSSDFNVILSALKTLNNTKIVSNPTIVTLNNTEAFINIGQEFPIPNYTYNAERGAFEVSGFTYKPIGIIMKVTPQVNAQGLIKLTVEPEVSQTNGATSFGGAGGASIPIIATRKARTQVSLQNGFTMGIGGLITSSKDHGQTKVPVLGDVPGLGRLFKSKAVNDTATNLIIFLTARTVSADGATPEDVFDPSAINAIGGLTPENLPGQRARR
ncbi:MAG TPA: secretin N-terminal domain-containing protein [Opitutaceae bacterium]|nr:secretin N-terminal domain-containing protein [Opitutaceae bacterium]